MGERDDLQGLTGKARDSFRTLRATARIRRNEDRFAEVRDRLAESGKGPGILFVVDGDWEPGETSERLERLWLERPDRVRSEVEGETTFVSDGSRAWAIDAGGAWTAVPPENAGPRSLRLLLDPAPVLDDLGLEATGRARVAGRVAVLVLARPRTGDFGWSDEGGLAPGADEYELAVDAERGILLRAVARSGGLELARTELLEIACDEPIPPETFAAEPPPGAKVRSLEELVSYHAEELPLEEVAARASFPVWALDPVPAGWRTEAAYWARQEAWSQPERVDLLYESPDGGASVHLLELARADGLPLVPRRRRDGVERVHVEKEATSIRIHAVGLPAGRLAELTAALVPLSAGR